MSIAYWFRVIDDDKQPTGYVGLAVAETYDELMLAIDEYVDPMCVELKKAEIGGFCVLVDPDMNSGEYEFTEHEVSDYLPFPDDNGWRTPRWVKRS